MSILDKVKIGNSVQVNLELSKDRLTKETIDAINSGLLIYFNNYDFLKTASRILFIKIVNTLKNTKNRPNQPNMTASDNILEPKSRCRKFCI